MNFHDSTRIAEIMEEAGYDLTDDPAEADLVVANTCSVREKAWHKAVSELGRFCTLKKTKNDLVVVAAGCVSQQEGRRIFEMSPLVDLVVGPDRYQSLPEMVLAAIGDSRKICSVEFDEGEPDDFLPTRPRSNRDSISAYVTVMKGCDERCAYCIVPTVRGPERFREPDDILSEAETLVDDGVKEITLLGQKVNGYSFRGVEFTDLLKRLDRIDRLARVRFTSPHPKHMSRSLVDLFGGLRTLCESIHLPVQAGSDRVLNSMNRRYTAGYYKEVARALRQSCPGIGISTDLIVGFPGESGDDFERTVDLLEEVRFSGIFSFKYSPRPGTTAAMLPDDVPTEEKVRRLDVVHEVTRRIEREIRESLVGRKLEVLVEGRGRNIGQLTGRARNNQIVHFVPPNGDTLEDMRGRLVEIRITGALPHCIEGEPASGGAA